jgi:predicted ATPase
MKIQKIEVTNFKPVANQEIDLNGCSAIVTAANGKGKSSLLSGLIDRLRSEKPDKIVKEGEESGNYTMQLTDGSIIEWNFTQKSERLSYTTAEGIKQTSGVIGSIGARYFGKGFDIDSFLDSGPKAQQKQLENICGIDIEEIEERYQKAYQERTEANRELKRVRGRNLEEPEKIEKPDVESVKEALKAARDQNEKHREAMDKIQTLDNIEESIVRIITGTDYEDLFNHTKAKEIRNSIEVPDTVDLSNLEQILEDKQKKLRKYDGYERDLREYQEWIKEGKAAKKEAEKADGKVTAIEQEKADAIAAADMPEGFTFDEEGLRYEGFALDKNQLSKSAIYIAALKLGAMVVGEVRCLYFDASSLDNNNLSKVQKWAEGKGLQLLIERPDFDGGDITYELIEK